MFLCCGDALFDLFIQDTGGSPSDGKAALAGAVGGSPMNVAVGLARLGHDSHYLTQLSTDLFGQRMRAYLEDNGLGLSLCADTDQNTTLAIVEKNSDGSARYVFYTDNTADTSMLETALPTVLPDDIRVVHFGSYTTAVRPTGDTLLALARRESSQRLISYDPNLRPSIEPDQDRWREVFAGFASQADIVKASDEDIQTLFGNDKEDFFVAECINYGASVVFITRGSNGGSAFDKTGNSAHAGGVEVDVVDTVGAGDTFQASILHWLKTQHHLDGGADLTGTVDLETCLNLAIRAAAITCSRSGADMPWLREI